MAQYLLQFSVYTLAMIGLIFLALFVYKKTSVFTTGVRKTSMLKVVDVLNVSPRKSFYVISAGNEQFLVASDADKMNLISKLENSFEEDK